MCAYVCVSLSSLGSLLSGSSGCCLLERLHQRAKKVTRVVTVLLLDASSQPLCQSVSLLFSHSYLTLSFSHTFSLMVTCVCVYVESLVLLLTWCPAATNKRPSKRTTNRPHLHKATRKKEVKEVGQRDAIDVLSPRTRCLEGRSFLFFSFFFHLTHRELSGCCCGTCPFSFHL